jgi:hypothetical protein
MNSSTANAKQTLASMPFRIRAQKLLVNLVSLPDNEREGLDWLRANCPFVLEDLPSQRVDMETQFDDGEVFGYTQPVNSDESKYKYLVLRLRDSLRALWKAPDKETKRWGIFRISQVFFLQGDNALIRAPLSNEWDFLLTSVRPPSRTERLLLKFIDLADYARCCGGSDCAAPFFIASRRNQKYCSLKCSRESQREFKREWWAKNGKAWRSGRRTKTKAKKQSGRCDQTEETTA